MGVVNSPAPNYTYAKMAYDRYNETTSAGLLCPFDELDLATKLIWHNTATVVARASGRLYLHVKKRLADEFGIELDVAWEARVVAGEHDVPLPNTYEVTCEVMRRSLDNVRMTALRILRKQNMGRDFLEEYINHILRFCSEAGVTGSILRSNPTLVDAVVDATMFKSGPHSDPTKHAYTTHATYTGYGCAMCGRPEEEHAVI